MVTHLRYYITEMEKNRIDQNKCKKCHKCVDQCFMHAIIVDDDGKVRIIEDKCIACGACAQMCTMDAIIKYVCPI